MSALLAQLHFLRPLWLLALLLLPLLLWQWRRRQVSDNPWRGVCDSHLLPHLLQTAGSARARWPKLLFAVGYGIAVLALAGPAFRQLPQALARADSALIVALDLSDRMRVADLKPDRVSRVRFKLSDLLKARREGQTALVAYAGDAFTVAPLTDDAESLSDLLASLTPDTMPARGQRADRAITLAQQLLHDAGFSRGDLLLVTDRVDARAQDAAAVALAAGLRTSVLGVGTLKGAPVALPQGGFAQDEDGNVLLPRLEESSLQALAAAGGGRYVRLSVGARDLDLLAFSDNVDADAMLRKDERTRAAYHDEGPWLLLLLLPLAALSFRRGWMAGIVLLLALPTSEAQAFDWSALWQRDDQRAWDALQADQAQQALELARDPSLRGSAAYRAEDYATSEQAFAQRDEADAHYNRGNALARAGRFEEAITAYDEALARAPQMQDAEANRKAVQDWLQQQNQQQSGQDQEQDPQQGEQGDASQQQGDPQQGDASESQQQDKSEAGQEDDSQSSRQGESDAASDPASEAEGESGDDQAQQQFSEQMQQALEAGEQQEGEQQAQALDPREAEQQQAVEQWLRRVPDDPGGLLRRKFALEHQRRVRERGEENP